MSGVIVIGGGQAAGQLAAGLRQQNYTQPIHIFSDEHHPPYQRPPLSKQFLSGEWEFDRLQLRPPSYYVQKDVRLHLATPVTRIDRTMQRVTTATGEHFTYDDLVIATGSRARRLGISGSDLANIFYLRGVDDVLAIRAALTNGKRVAIVGGGYIGLEVAAVARKLGLAVTVVEMEERILQRVATPAMSAFFHRVHCEHGVDIRVGTRVSALVGDGAAGRDSASSWGSGSGSAKVTGITTTEGETIAADIVIVGVGVLPNVELAAEAGLVIDNGILVDAHCRTDDAHIYAIGDCARGYNAALERHIRLESVPNAMEQARVAAANICGKSSRYDTMPWFWSDQYDVKLQMVGFAADGPNAVVRGDPARNAFITFYMAGRVVVAAEAVNMAREFLLSRQLCEKRVVVDPAILVDPAADLKALLA